MPDTVDAAPTTEAPKMTHGEKVRLGRLKAAAARAAASALNAEAARAPDVAAPVAPSVSHAAVALGVGRAVPMNPVEFLTVFFSTNPGLIQVLEAYPNKTEAARGLYLVAYEAYLTIVEKGTPLWERYDAVKAKVGQ